MIEFKYMKITVKVVFSAYDTLGVDFVMVWICSVQKETHVDFCLPIHTFVAPSRAMASPLLEGTLNLRLRIITFDASLMRKPPLASPLSQVSDSEIRRRW